MIEHEMKKSLDLPSKVTIYPSQDRAIDKVLTELMSACPAQYALLAESSGQLITLCGERETGDPVSLASLIAGDMAASQEIARITGQYQHYQFVLREGIASNTFISEAGEHLLLFVQVAKNVPLGWARLIISEAGRKLADIMVSEPEEAHSFKFEVASDELDRWANDALNSLWEK
jgi:predicted regulator of Ras-like GTPase activity (Roadblock/LC7/MglB family)